MILPPFFSPFLILQEKMHYFLLAPQFSLTLWNLRNVLFLITNKNVQSKWWRYPYDSDAHLPENLWRFSEVAFHKTGQMKHLKQFVDKLFGLNADLADFNQVEKINGRILKANLSWTQKKFISFFFAL